MTDSQRTKFYIPAWLDIQAATGWRMAGGRLVAQASCLCGSETHGQDARATTGWSPLALDVIAAIVAAAQRTAAGERRAVTADDLRKGCNLVASGGRTDASRKFSQTNFNHFDRLRDLLCRDRGHNLTAIGAWLDPAEDDRRRTLRYLRELAHEARLASIAKNAWGQGEIHVDVDQLDKGQLDWLLLQVKGGGWKKYPTKKLQPF